MTFRITVLLSGRQGRGSNMAALAEACRSGLIPRSEVACVIGTHIDSPALARARELGLATVVVDGRSETFEEELLSALDNSRADLICLAGYMRKLPLTAIRQFPNKILNVHPALLPAFGGKGMYGHHIHEAVLAYGCKLSGATVHLVDEDFDNGPIVMQEAVPILEGDTAETLAARVLAVEHEIYPLAVSRMAEGRVSVQGRRVRLD